MQWAVFKNEVESRLVNHPQLKPIFHDIHGIAQRIREVDDTLFICRNLFYGRFEVHSLEHRPNTFAWVIPWRNLDVRVIKRAIKSNLLARGDTIFDEVDQHNAKLKESNDRDFRNNIEAAAIEARSLFKPLAWEM